MTFKEMEQKEAILTAEKHWAQLHNMPETAFKEYETTG
jgi:metal-dependent amidase/aminoacylase/carboxypeptidase family protein